MKHCPASRFYLPLQGLSISEPVQLPLARRRFVWFVLGFFAASAFAGLIAGGTLP